jgi:two-component system response regulator AtoC
MAFSKEQGKAVRSLSREAARSILEYDYPGNVRELANVIEHGVLMADGEVVEPADLPPEFVKGSVMCPEPAAEELEAWLGGKRLDDIEALAIRAALGRSGGHRGNTARSLGISERGLRNKLREYRLE